MKLMLLMMVLGMATSFAFAATTGSISGTAHDEQGAVLQSTTVTLKNTLTGEVRTIQTDDVGFYSFPSVPLGNYEMTFEKAGFEKYHESNIVIDVDTQRRVDATMKVGKVEDQVTVTSTQAQVDTESSQMGEVIGGKEMTNIPLNGRSYTDLLALQPGVVPISVSNYGSEAPANTFNNGLLSMSGAQDVHSGFLVNGANTVDGAGEGTFLIPTLDSIAEFRIVTNNAGAEYGGYSGGVVNVITKSGTNQFHGDAFEFFRNSILNGAGFNQGAPNLKQNQFGGVLGGPILHNKLFFFGDYQGTRNSSATNPDIVVPTTADVTGNLADRAANFIKNAKNVSGPYFATILSQRLGHTVTSGEPYYFAQGEALPSGNGVYATSCTTSSQCVLPNLQLPKSAWSGVSANVLSLIPPPNTAGNQWESSQPVQTLTEDKGAIRIDGDTRFGRVSGYYHLDPWSNPAPATFGNAVTGFPNETIGKAQLYVVGLTTPFGSTAVNTFTASYTRNKNITGLTSGGGVTLSSLGFDSPANGGPYQESTSQYQNWPDIVLNEFSVGAPVAVVSQFNNVYGGMDDFSKVIRTHSLKFGAQYHWDQVDLSHPNNGSNGEFIFNGSETGDDFADLLLGAPSNFFQGSPAGLDLRTFYAGAYAEDSWRANRDLTINYGVRWEVDPFWREGRNLNPVELPGIQSTTFPTAPVGYAFPGDAGIPVHMSKINYDNFGPRMGVAYTPDFTDGFLHKVFGTQGQSSVRAGYGLYFTNIEGYNTFNFASPPYALFYSSPARPLFTDPFIDRASGNKRIQPFPLNPLSNPSAVNWASFEPLSARRNPLESSPSPYEEHADFAVERSVTANTILTLGYVGTFGHHLTVMADGNSGNPALCLGVSQTNEVAPNTATCGPGGENSVYHTASGATINGTRQGLGSLFQGVGWELNVGNSAYHAFETTLRHTGSRYSYLFSYTFSKGLDNGSGRGDIVLLNGNRNFYRGLSDYDVPNNFVTSYSVEIPFDKFIHANDRIVRGWVISGATRFTNGVPVWISEPDDQDLLGDTKISPWGASTDQPNYTRGNLMGDHNPRHGNPYFNINLFSEENLGQIGNSPKRFFHGPGINNTDLTLMKDVKIREGMTAEFRLEGFNAFNHAQFYGEGTPDGNFTDSSFGMIFGSNGGRVGQVAAKFTF